MTDPTLPAMVAALERLAPTDPWVTVEITTESYQPDDECGYCRVSKPRLKRDRGPEAHQPNCAWVQARSALQAAAAAGEGATGDSWDEQVRRAIYSVWPGLAQDDTERLVAALRSSRTTSETLRETELRAALVKYGNHQSHCKLTDYNDCTCGWSAFFMANIAP